MRRRSAFVIFQAIKPLLNAGKLLTGNKLLKNDSDSSKPILDRQRRSMLESTDMNDEQIITSPVIQNAGGVNARKSTNRTNNNTATATVTSTAIINGQESQKCSTTKIVQQNVRKPLKSSSCDSNKKLARSNRDKMLQEKEDFQLAKMLQECIGTSDTSSRYSLRSRFRNKSSVSSSLSSSASSTQDLFQLKYGGSSGGGGAFVGIATSKRSSMPYPDSSSSTNDTTSTRTSTTLSGGGGGAGAAASRSQRNNSNDNSNDKFTEFSFQKLTRSRRIAMTMSGV